MICGRSVVFSPIATIVTEILLKVALNAINLTKTFDFINCSFNCDFILGNSIDDYKVVLPKYLIIYFSSNVLELYIYKQC